MKNKQLLEGLKNLKSRLGVLSEDIERDPSFNFFDRVRELEDLMRSVTKSFNDEQILQLYIWRKIAYRFLYSTMSKQEGEKMFMDIFNNLKKFQEIYPNEKLDSNDSYDVITNESKKYPLTKWHEKLSTKAQEKAKELEMDFSSPKEE
jgi:hypothetical protein